MLRAGTEPGAAGSSRDSPLSAAMSSASGAPSGTGTTSLGRDRARAVFSYRQPDLELRHASAHALSQGGRIVSHVSVLALCR